MSNKVVIIDGDTIMYLATYFKEVALTYKQVLLNVDYYVKMILDNTKTNNYSGFLTNGSFRYKIATQKEYKGHRKDIPKPKFFNLAKAYLIDEYNFVIERNYEADDLCIMAHNSLRLKGYDVIIATPDKDLKQIPCLFYDYKKNELIDLSWKEADKNLWMQVLTGDTGDNIPGLAGIGPVKAEKILKDSKDYKQTVLEYYVKVYGEYNGIIYFTENYQLIKMVDNFNGSPYPAEIHERIFPEFECEF